MTTPDLIALGLGWRPFEPSADEAKRIEREREDNTCNRHSDCAAANTRARAAGRISAEHCHDGDCEDCFGK